MKNIRKRVFALTATIAMIVTLLPTSIFAEESEMKESNTNVLEKGPQTRETTPTPVPDVACTINADGVITAIDTAQLGGSVNITIPDTIRGTTVKGIQGSSSGSINVFGKGLGDTYTIETIDLPNTLTSIGEYAFEYCDSLTSINIPNNVTSIESFAFSACENLESVVLPNNLTSLDFACFNGCIALTDIDIPESITSISNAVFYKAGLTNIDIPNSVTSIGDEAFSYCNNLTNVNMPDNITSIGYRAFGGCYKLEKVMIRSEKDDYDDHMNSLIDAIISPSSLTVTKYLGNTKFEAKQAQMNSFGEQVYDLDDLITVPTVYKYNADGTKEKSNDFQFSPVTYKLEKQSRSGTTRLDTVNKKLYIAEDENSILTLSATYEGKTVSTAITASPVALESIEVKTNPTQTEYRDGDIFKPDGLVITQIYNNGNQNDVVYDNEKSNFTFDLSLLKTEDKEVTVTYAGKQTKIDIEVLRKAILANPDLNVIEGMKESYTQGDHVSFTVRGDKQDNVDPVKDDTRYVPASWKVTETISFNDKYEGSFSAMELGKQVLSVTFNLEEYDGSQWILKGTDIKEKEFTVTEKVQIEVPETPVKDSETPIIKEENKPIEDSSINTINPEKDSKDIIETGDETSLFIYLEMMILSGLAGYLFIKKCREKGHS